MSVGIFFDIKRSNGGSYQMAFNNLEKLIQNFKRKKIHYKIFTNKKNIDLDKLAIKYELTELNKLDYIFLFLNRIKFLFFFLKFLNISSYFEKFFINNNVSLVIFFHTSWKSFLLNKINFISTILDTAHVDYKGIKKFKEISIFVRIYREYLYKNVLPKAKIIITESSILKKNIIKLYKLNSKNIISIPNLSSRLLLINKKKTFKNKKKKLKNFYFYPAQFWEHKNHILILKAVKKLKLLNYDYKFIFCGKDKGNLSFIKKKIIEYDLLNNILIYDYVTENELLDFYKSCEALVMPTFFGPTNIPPVEAWSLQKPVIYSSPNKQHGKDAALYCNPFSENDLVKCLLKIKSKKIKKTLINKGNLRIKSLVKENFRGHNLILKKIGSLQNSKFN